MADVVPFSQKQINAKFLCLSVVFNSLMNYKPKMKIISWNVRGLNDRQKRLEVRQTMLLEKPNIICLQETKISQMERNVFKEICGNHLRQMKVLNANGTRGGILIAWTDKRFEELDSDIREFTITFKLKSKQDQNIFYLTGVYGPSVSTIRQRFLDELQAIRPTDNTP